VRRPYRNGDCRSMKRLRAALRAFMNPALRLPRPIPPPEAATVVVLDKLLEGRTALVTGAGGLIGKTLARELLAHGANVWCTDLDAGQCARLQNELGGKSRVLRADITRQEDTDALLAALTAEN